MADPIEPKVDYDNLPAIVGNMWFELAERIAEGIADAYVSDGPEKAMRFAQCAEACYWQSGSEMNCFDVRQIVEPTSFPAIRAGE